MEIVKTVEGLKPLTEQDARKLCAPHLLMAFERARDCSVQLELIGTRQEKIADANVSVLRAEVMRRLEAFKR